MKKKQNFLKMFSFFIYFHHIFKLILKLFNRFCYIFTENCLVNIIEKFNHSNYQKILKFLYFVHVVYVMSEIIKFWLGYFLFEHLMKNILLLRKYDIILFLTIKFLVNGHKVFFLAAGVLFLYRTLIIRFALFDYLKAFQLENDIIQTVYKSFKILDYIKIICNINKQSIQHKIQCF